MVRWPKVADGQRRPVANLDGAQLDVEEALEELPMFEPEPGQDTEGQLKPLDLDSTQEPSLWWLKGLQ